MVSTTVQFSPNSTLQDPSEFILSLRPLSGTSITFRKYLVQNSIMLPNILMSRPWSFGLRHHLVHLLSQKGIRRMVQHVPLNCRYQPTDHVVSQPNDHNLNTQHHKNFSLNTYPKNLKYYSNRLQLLLSKHISN